MIKDTGLEMQERLRKDLRDAWGKKEAEKVTLLRTLLAALDNAEAPKLESGNGLVEHQFVDGSAEIERNILSREQRAFRPDW
nr:hypothetical protein [uncultured Cohaesibacter sp.]